MGPRDPCAEAAVAQLRLGVADDAATAEAASAPPAAAARPLDVRPEVGVVVGEAAGGGHELGGEPEEGGEAVGAEGAAEQQSGQVR